MLSTFNSLTPSDLYKGTEDVKNKEFEYNEHNTDLSAQQDELSSCDSDGSEICDDIVLTEHGKNDASFGNICVQNSADIHFGNKTVYQGPVTIKQIVYTNSPDNTQDVGNNVHKIPNKCLPVSEKENGILNGGIKSDSVKTKAIVDTVGNHPGVEKSN